MADRARQKTTPPWALHEITLITDHNLSLCSSRVRWPSNGSSRFNSDVSPVTKPLSDWLISQCERHQPEQRPASYTISKVMNVNIRDFLSLKKIATFNRGKKCRLFFLVFIFTELLLYNFTKLLIVNPSKTKKKMHNYTNTFISETISQFKSTMWHVANYCV